MAWSRCSTHPGHATSSSAAFFARRSAGRFWRSASITGLASPYAMKVLDVVDCGPRSDTCCDVAPALTLAALLAQATEIAIEDVALLPSHYQVNTWALRKGLKYKARSDEYTLATHVSGQ